tara:strand:+ start:884 stop:1447 length:564 start_codon:yes stop_codon:yes gene_type:complete
MRSPHYFIVKPKSRERYSAEREINGSRFTLSSFEEDVSITNREGIVISVPLHYTGEIKPGDTLLIHHNVFRHHSDIQGKRVNDKSFFSENEFFVDIDQFFMYKRNGEWQSHDRYCFVKPIRVKTTGIKDGSKYEPLKAVMVYPNKMLIDKGVKRGDVIGHIPHVEYPFTVDGEELYRLFDHHISLKY